MDVVLRPATPADCVHCARIKNAWIDATDWMPRCHPADDVERHYREVVLAHRKAMIAEVAGKAAGYIAVELNEGFVTSLFVDAAVRGQSVGKHLLDDAKAKWPGGLQLWTFVANTEAQRFYLREGFREVQRTEGDNEEGLPDIRYTWQATP